MSKALTQAAAAPAPAVSSKSAIAPHKIAIGLLAAAVLVGGIVFGVRHWRFYVSHQETDDAQVEGHVSPVLPRVSGYVTRVFVADNQRVSAGQPLVEIDARELDVRVAGANAALQNSLAQYRTAQASLESTRAQAGTAQANVETALVRQRKAAGDLARDTSLAKTGAITESQLTDTKAASDTADAELASQRTQARTAELQIAVAQARTAAAKTESEEKASDLDFAKLERSYATVTAPIAGLVSRKSVEAGQYVQSGQTLCSITSEDDVWVVANFKETQLTRMKVGQDTDFEADTYPGYVFHGRVESISGATGAQFALLPPDNSTGNFVKVTQRIPVKIVLSEAPDADHPLRPGMSVDATVATGR
jgi:membrane fusion protein (multidrug efflux system)